LGPLGEPPLPLGNDSHFRAVGWGVANPKIRVLIGDALKKICRAPRPTPMRREHPAPVVGEVALPGELNSNATGASVLSADYHPTAVEQVGHGGDKFAAVAGAGSYDRDKFTEAVFGFVDFFVDVFHRSFSFAVFDSIRNANVQK
jgi:hypothetical protein